MAPTLLVCYFLSLLVTEIQAYPLSKLVNISRNLLFTDVINLPNSMCRTNNRFCGQMNAISGSQPTHCFCYCPYHKRTFYERHWKCADDQEIRKKEGCKILFQGEKLSDPITTIAESRQNYINVSKSDECRFFIWPTLGINQYLACNGQWKQMTSGDVWYPFHLIGISWSKLLSIRKNQRAKLSHPKLMGRLVKLAVQCRANNFSRIHTSCILFKVDGNETCPIPNIPSRIATKTSLKSIQPTRYLGKSSLVNYTPVKYSPVVPSRDFLSSAVSSVLTSLSIIPTNVYPLKHTASMLEATNQNLKGLRSSPSTAIVLPFSTIYPGRCHILLLAIQPSSFSERIQNINTTILETFVTKTQSNNKLIERDEAKILPSIIAGIVLTTVLAVVTLVVLGAIFIRRRMLRANLSRKTTDQLSYALPKYAAERGQYNNVFDNAAKRRNHPENDQNSLHERTITRVSGLEESLAACGKQPFASSEPSICVQEIPLNESARESTVVTVCPIYEEKYLVSEMKKEKDNRKYFSKEVPTMILLDNPIYESICADTVITDNPLYESVTATGNEENGDQM